MFKPLLLCAALLSAGASSFANERHHGEANDWTLQGHFHYVSFKPAATATPVPGLPEAIGARMLLPDHLPAPAVLLLHGSSGADSRLTRYAHALRDAGFVTLEVDVWHAMGVTPERRPRTVHETMPSVWGALGYLAGRPEVDASKIGVQGFSWGGVQTMLAAREPLVAGKPHFSAFRASYPLCFGYNRIPGYEMPKVSGPLQIAIGDKDDYDESAGPCRALAGSLNTAAIPVELKVYENSFHGFDRLEPEITITDPYSHLGRGGSVTLKPNHGEAHQSIRDALRFFKAKLK